MLDLFRVPSTKRNRSSNFYQLNAATFTNVTLTGNINASGVVLNNLLTTPTGLTVASTTGTSVNLSWNKSTVLGDTNGDNLINLVDYNNVKNNFGTSGLGDTNGDGIINLIDYNNVKNNFGILNAGPTGYIIERSSDGITYTQFDTVGANVTSYTDNNKNLNLSDGQRYSYRVRAMNASGVSPNLPSCIGHYSVRCDLESKRHHTFG